MENLFPVPSSRKQNAQRNASNESIFCILTNILLSSLVAFICSFDVIAFQDLRYLNYELENRCLEVKGICNSVTLEI